MAEAEGVGISFFVSCQKFISMTLPDSARQRLEQIEYPSFDGNPMADNTKQARWIITLYNNLRGMFASDSVFVAADLLWYPLEGEPTICQAPDVLVAFGRPDGDRSSYKQWEEEDVAPQVVIEILSPSNTIMEMLRKQAFYHEYGVEELIVIDPGKTPNDPESFLPYLRTEKSLKASQFEMVDWTSPRLGIRFRKSEEEGNVQVFAPDGTEFKSFEALQADWKAERQRADQASQRAEAEKNRAEAEKQRADAAEAELQRLRKLMEDREN